MKLITNTLSILVLLVSSVIADDVQVEGTTEIVALYSRESNRRSPTTFEVEAFKNPGVEFPVWKTSLEQVNFFYSKTVSVSDQTVTYDAVEKRFKYAKTQQEIQNGKPQFQVYKALLLMAILASVLGNVAFGQGLSDGAPLGVSFISLFLAVAAGIAAAISGTWAVLSLFIVTAVISCLVLSDSSWRNRWLYTVHSVAVCGVYLIALFV